MRTSTTEPAFPTRGFTLVEVLVVVLIVGLLVSVVAVRLTSGTRQSLHDEALRLAALLAHARDEAIATGAPLAWQGSDAGYRFLRRGPDRTWQPMDGDADLRARSLPAGVRLAIETPAQAGAVRRSSSLRPGSPNRSASRSPSASIGCGWPPTALPRRRSRRQATSGAECGRVAASH
jgi:type II secretion system protein H